MAEPTRERKRILALREMLLELTDDEHGLSMSKILAKLADRGIPAERKAIYRDIAALREAGLDIQTYERAPVEYGLATRPFSLDELSLMVDAVQSSRFLTNRRSDLLVRKIRRLASKPQRASLSRSVHVEGRVRTPQESALPNMALVQKAIHLGRQVAFLYCDWSPDLRRVARVDEEGETKAYRESPLRVVYSADNYYMISYNEKHAGIAVYRIDRMSRLRLCDEPIVQNDVTRSFDGGAFANRSFSMYSGRTVMATFLIDPVVMDAFVDRFGKDMTVEVEGKGDGIRARVTANVMDSPTLYGWIAQFGTHVKIEGPDELIGGFRSWLQSTLDSY